MTTDSLLKKGIPLTYRRAQGEPNALLHKEFPAHAELVEA
jgi:hypothetical protein